MEEIKDKSWSAELSLSNSDSGSDDNVNVDSCLNSNNAENEANPRKGTKKKKKKEKEKEKEFQLKYKQTKFKTIKPADRIYSPEEDKMYKVILKKNDTLTIKSGVEAEKTIAFNDYYKYTDYRKIKIVFVDILRTHDLILPVNININLSQFMNEFGTLYSTNILRVYYQGKKVEELKVQIFHEYDYEKDFLLIAEEPAKISKQVNSSIEFKSLQTVESSLKCCYIISPNKNIQICKIGFVSKTRFALVIELFELSDEYNANRSTLKEENQRKLYTDKVLNSDWQSKSNLVYSSSDNAIKYDYDNDYCYHRAIARPGDYLFLNKNSAYIIKLFLVGNLDGFNYNVYKHWVESHFYLMRDDGPMIIKLLKTRVISDFAFLK